MKTTQHAPHAAALIAELRRTLATAPSPEWALQNLRHAVDAFDRAEAATDATSKKE